MSEREYAAGDRFWKGGKWMSPFQMARHVNNLESQLVSEPTNDQIVAIICDELEFCNGYRISNEYFDELAENAAERIRELFAAESKSIKE